MVMVSVLASSAVDRGFESRSIQLVCVASLLSTQNQGVRAKTGRLGIRIITNVSEWGDMSIHGLLLE